VSRPIAASRHNGTPAGCSRSETLDTRPRGGFADQITSAHALGNNNVLEARECPAETPKPGDESPTVGSPESSPEANTHARVFISYASHDVAIADAVIATLERHGVACWIAPRDVKAGALYAEPIVRAISSAKALVLVLSESSVASAHVGKEVERASSKRRPVIALRIDDTPLSPALEYFLGESQWIDARASGMETKSALDSAYRIVELHAYRGEIDSAFQWLDRAYRQHDGGMIEVRVDPLLQNLHRDQRTNPSWSR
jgi:TIR domain